MVSALRPTPRAGGARHIRRLIATLLCTAFAFGPWHAAVRADAPEGPEPPAGGEVSAAADPVAETSGVPLDPRTTRLAAGSSGTRYRYRLELDLPVTLAAAAVALGPRVFGDETEGPTPGDADAVFVLDRFVARSPEARSVARTTSDVVLLSSLALGALGTVFTVDPHTPAAGRVRERFRRLGIFAQSIFVTNAVTTVVKLAARRPRPFTYAPGYDPSEGHLDDELSYFSGHASSVAAASATATYLAFAERGRDGRRFAILGTGVVASLGVATLRVRAARHFPTDVATGVLVGASLGVLVPALHRRAGLALDVAHVPGGGVVALRGLR